MKKERTKKVYSQVACGNKITITRTGSALEVFIDGHPLVDVSIITKRVFLYTSLQSHEREFLTVSDEGAYLPTMWGEKYIQP